MFHDFQLLFTQLISHHHYKLGLVSYVFIWHLSWLLEWNGLQDRYRPEAKAAVSKE